MNIKKTVALFYPKTERENINRNIPLSLLKVGSELKNAGYKVLIIDERLHENYDSCLKEVLPEILFFGVSSMTGYQIRGGLKASSFVRAINKEIPIVWGGWHASILPEEALKNGNIDIVVRGQGEVTIRQLADALSLGNSLEDINGIAYKDNGSYVINNLRELEDLNNLAPIDFDIIDIRKYILKTSLGRNSIFWHSSQGCPYRCGFCSTPTVYNRRWTALNSEKLVQQLVVLAKEYKIDGITFAEDNFFVDLKRVEELSHGILENNIKIKWATDVRIDQINHFSDKFLHLLKESGCIKLYVGAETGDEDILELIDKKIKPTDIIRAAERLNEYKIISEFFMIFGFPINPQQDLRRSFGIIRKIKSNFPDHQFTPFLYTPYPGTPLLNLAVKKGLKTPKKIEDWQEWSILQVSTPWINKGYLDKINMHVKCFYPLAFPSASLKSKFQNGYRGFLYKILHKIAAFRVENNFFVFPVEWILIKIFYKLKIKLNLFRDTDSFR